MTTISKVQATRRWVRLWFFAAVLAAPACRTAAPFAGTRAQADSIMGGGASEPVFMLEPGDVVKLQVYQEKDLNNLQLAVNESGKLTLPLLGTTTVTHREWPTVRDSLLAEYARQIKNTPVVLTPLRRVQVLGEVTKPGQYFADPTLSLAGVVALAGGATPLGDLHHVRVVRGGRTIIESASVESLLLQASVHSNDQVFVDRRSWLERNGSIAASTLLSAAGIVVALIRR